MTTVSCSFLSLAGCFFAGGSIGTFVVALAVAARG